MTATTRHWQPWMDGLGDAQFLDYVDRLGYTAVARAIGRNVATIRRAYFRLTEHAP